MKKRLGQYFSGDKIADVLVSITNPSLDADIIDPMAGSGDMLSAASRFGVPTNQLYGVEIDADIFRQCEKKKLDTLIKNADAFVVDYFDSFGKTSWDLVITNPPYVRYQSLVSSDSVTSAKQIRDNLRITIRNLKHLSASEKKCFLEIADSYSGLSDLAVPSWILCAALTKIGGTLAMVVPESWINREYAVAIKYLLLKLFDIQYVVEDVNAAWFPDALVKTNLVTAKRVPSKKGIQEVNGQSYRRIRLSASLIGEISLIDNLQHNERMGFDALRYLLEHDGVGQGFDSASISLENFVAAVSSSKLFSKIAKTSRIGGEVLLPDDMRKAIKLSPKRKMATLDKWGVTVGQGLRTGANSFFYAECVDDLGDGFEQLKVSDAIQSDNVFVPKSYLLPTLRYQGDIADSYVVRASMLVHRLIYIQENISGEYQSLTNYIEAANSLAFLKNGKEMRFRDLSAVKPNIRADGTRDWYMIPALAKRHRPQLCISRVIYKRLRCLLVQDDVVVDANFSTLWTEAEDLRLVYALFALLNSSFVQACLDISATVMGGGALKVEASHIRATPVPQPSEEIIAKLYPLGEKLSKIKSEMADEIIREIDKVIMAYCFDDIDLIQTQALFAEFVAKKEAERKR